MPLGDNRAQAKKSAEAMTASARDWDA